MKMKLCLVLTLVAGFATTVFAQTKIKDGTVTGSSSLPAGGAVLELESNSKGFLLPRVALTTTTTWGLSGSGINGMSVYNTSASITSSNISYPIIPGGIGVYYFDGTGWVATNPAAGNFWKLTGNSGTNSGANFLGTTDNHALKFKVNNTLAGFIDSLGGGQNTFLGYSAGSNTAANIGTGAGSYNVFTGYRAGFTNTTGNYNVFSGTSAGDNNLGGAFNVILGAYAGYNNTSGSYNLFSGANAGSYNTTGNQNTYAGYNAGYFVTTGINNTAFGHGALSATGSAGVVNNANTAVGPYSLYSTTTGSNNIAVGYSANDLNTTGGNNISIGYNAMHGNNGSNNVAIGYQSGTAAGTSTNSNITLLGYNTKTTGANANTLTNAGAIGANASVGLSNSMVLGDSSLSASTYAVNVGIGVRSPQKRLHIDASTANTASKQADSLKIDNLASTSVATNKGVLVIDTTTGYVSAQSIATTGAKSFWAVTGNTGTNSGANFTGGAADGNYVGTTDTARLVLATGGIKRMFVDQYSNAFGGTNTTHYPGTINSFDWGNNIADSGNNNGIFGLNQTIYYINGKGGAFGESHIVKPNPTAGSDRTSNYLVAGKSNTLVSAAYSGVFGNANIDSSEYTFMAGSNNIIGNNAWYTTVFGFNNSVSTIYNTAVGLYNKDTSTALFAVGNGTGTAARSNAVTVTSGGRVGVNNVNNPTSTLQVAGSVAASIRTASSSTTLTSSDYTLILSGVATAGSITVTFPQASTCPGRIYVVINSTSTAANSATTATQNFSSYNGTALELKGSPGTSAATATITGVNYSAGGSPVVNNQRTTWQSDGTVWWLIGLM